MDNINKILKGEYNKDAMKKMISDIAFGRELPEECFKNIPSYLANISDMATDVLATEYGIFDGKRHTQRVVARILGITEEQVKYHKTQAFKTLRHPVRIKKLFAID